MTLSWCLLVFKYISFILLIGVKPSPTMLRVKQTLMHWIIHNISASIIMLNNILINITIFVKYSRIPTSYDTDFRKLLLESLGCDLPLERCKKGPYLLTSEWPLGNDVQHLSKYTPLLLPKEGAKAVCLDDKACACVCMCICVSECVCTHSGWPTTAGRDSTICLC